MRHAVLFDVDGVLVDSRAAQLATLAGYATSALGHRVAVEALPADAATTPREQVLASLGLAGAINDDAWDAATATASLTTAVFAFVTPALTALREWGVATGVVTSRSHRRVGWLLPAYVLDLIDTVVCYEDATPKPAPDCLLLALGRLGVAPHDAVFVGDMVIDMHAARAAGVPAIGAGWGFAGPKALADAGADLVLPDGDGLIQALLLLAGIGQPDHFSKRS